MKRVKNWLFLVLPPGWAVGLAIVFAAAPYLIIAGLHLYRRWLWSQMLGGPFEAESWGFEELYRLAAGNLLAICAVYGTYRAVAFHPIFRSRYSQWLQATPWETRHPLPLGPIHLVWQDLVILLPIGLLAYWHGPRDFPLAGPVIFLSAYLLFLMVTFWLTSVPEFGYGLAFGLSLLVLVSESLVNILIVAFSLYITSQWGLRRALRLFPQWDQDRLEELGVRPLTTANQHEPSGQKGLGWPFDRLSPRKIGSQITYGNGILLSVLVGWWLFVLLRVSHLQHGVNQHNALIDMFRGLSTALCAALAIGRIAIYCSGYAPPLNVRARIATFRGIIPGYDVVFLAPLNVVLVRVLLPMVGAELGIPPEINYPITITFMLLAALNLGPSLERWQLTGNHRIIPGVAGSEFIKR